LLEIFVKSLLLNLQFFLTSSLLKSDGVLTKTSFDTLTWQKKAQQKKLNKKRESFFVSSFWNKKCFTFFVSVSNIIFVFVRSDLALLKKVKRQQSQKRQIKIANLLLNRCGFFLL